jgi:hypothetical protein
MGSSHQVVTFSRDKILQVCNGHGDINRTPQSFTDSAERFPEREDALPEKLFAADVH